MTHLCNFTAKAISKVKDEQLSQRFRDTFFPDGKALRPGSLLRLPGLAAVLEAGLWNFYDGNFSQEMEDEVTDTDTVNRASFPKKKRFSNCNHSNISNVAAFCVFS